jgi:hypothetical protein
MKKLLLAALTLAALVPTAVRAEDFTRALASAGQFDSLYSEVVNRLIKAGEPMEQTCFGGANAYCSNWMAHSYADNDVLAAFNNTYKNGVSLKQICFGDATTRRCLISNGFIIDQKLQNNVWTNTRTVADGYAAS